MKILVAADMEGISGVVHWDQVDSKHGEYNRFRKLMTADVNAAIRGACEAGATEVIVADGHGSGAQGLQGHLEHFSSRQRHLRCFDIVATVVGYDRPASHRAREVKQIDGIVDVAARRLGGRIGEEPPHVVG